VPETHVFFAIYISGSYDTVVVKYKKWQQ